MNISSFGNQASRVQLKKTVEVFFNLLWLAIAALMFGVWLLRTARGSDPVRHSIGVQLIALALLIVILLPVVSLTDDLHAPALLAEADHVFRRSDFQAVGDLALHLLSVAIAAVTLLNTSPRSRTLAWLSFPTNKAASCAGYLHILGSRPPPAV